MLLTTRLVIFIPVSDENVLKFALMKMRLPKIISWAKEYLI